MRKLLIIASLLFAASVSNAAIGSIQTRPGGANNSIQYNKNGTFGGTFDITVTTITFEDGTVLTTAGGGSFGAIRVEDGGALVVNTSTVNFNGDQFIATNDGGEASVKLNNSSVTLMGSTFNTANVLVKLNASALIPNELLDNSSVTKLGSIIALGSETTGNYVKHLVAGLGMAVGAAGVEATPTVAFTPSLVTGNQTFGANNTASITWCFAIIGTDPCFTFSNGLVTVTNLTVSNTLTATTATITNADITNLTAGGINYPTSDGTVGQYMITDGAGNLSFTGAGISGDYVSSITVTAPLLGNTSGHVTLSIDKSSVTLLGPSIDIDELPAHAATHANGEIDEIDVTGLSGLLADPQTVIVSTDGTVVHTSSGINFIPGSNVTITGAANGGNTDITIAASNDGSGYAMEPATVTIQANFGVSIQDKDNDGIYPLLITDDDNDGSFSIGMDDLPINGGFGPQVVDQFMLSKVSVDGETVGQLVISCSTAPYEDNVAGEVHMWFNPGIDPYIAFGGAANTYFSMSPSTMTIQLAKSLKFSDADNSHGVIFKSTDIVTVNQVYRLPKVPGVAGQAFLIRDINSDGSYDIEVGSVSWNHVTNISTVSPSARLDLPSLASKTLTAAGQSYFDSTDGVLVIHDGSASRVFADEMQHFSVTLSTWYASSNWANDTFPIWQAPRDYAITITSITATAFSTSASSVTFNLEERAFNALNSAGTNVFTVAEATANVTGRIYTSSAFSNAGIAAGAYLVWDTDQAATGAVAKGVILTIYYRRDLE